MPKNLVLIFILSLLCSFVLSQDKTPIEPTDQETLILEYYNRYHSDPVAEVNRIRKLIISASEKRKYSFLKNWYVRIQSNKKLTFEQFIKNLSDISPPQPLAFNLKLIKAARAHSKYMAKANTSHSYEDKTKPGFTGRLYKDRIALQGYQSIVFAGYGTSMKRDAVDVYLNSIYYIGNRTISDWKYSLSKIYKNKSHFSEIGIGVSFRKFSSHNYFVADQILAYRKSTKRFVCGVIYYDKNGNNFYDIGEGLKGIEISASTGEKIVSWKSGAYTLAVNQNESIEVTMNHAGLVKRFTVKPGALNIKSDWLVGNASLVRTQLKLFKLSQQNPNSNNSNLLNLYFHLRQHGYCLDDRRNIEMKVLTRKVEILFEPQIVTLKKAISLKDIKKVSEVMSKLKHMYKNIKIEDFLNEASEIEKLLNKREELSLIKQENYNSDSVRNWIKLYDNSFKIKQKYNPSEFNNYWLPIQQSIQALIFGPTDEETIALEYMNRFRKSPKIEAELLCKIHEDPGHILYRKAFIGRHPFEFEMFIKELKIMKPVAPLFFDLFLLRSAKNHARYMILNNNLTHFEIPGKPGFTGKNPSARGRFAKYKDRVGENASLKHSGLLSGHFGFLIDSGPDRFGKIGKGGMQPGRGHRMAMGNKKFKIIGLAAVPWIENNRNLISFVHNFGFDSIRYIGGVIYNDKDKDNFYSVGEGVGGVVIKASDGTECKSWRSGAYALKLKSNKAVTITMEYANIKKTFTYPAGSKNKKADWTVVDKKTILKQRALLNHLEERPSKNATAKLFFHIQKYSYQLNSDENEKTKEFIASISTILSPFFADVEKLIQTRDVIKLKILLLKTKRLVTSPDLAMFYKEIDELRVGIEKLTSLQTKRANSKSSKYRRQLSKRSKTALLTIKKNLSKLKYTEYNHYWDLLIKDLRIDVSKGSSK
ncbi:MAG: hypothetical protein COA79_04395 [Planctomycetota bacterium]|nr:MAG: hypothetical protein COA79_04395 [Planctomycetota bacterium]